MYTIHFSLCVHLEEHTGILTCLLCTDLDFDTLDELQTHCSAHDKEEEEGAPMQVEETYTVIQPEEEASEEVETGGDSMQNVEKMTG